ncbi:MAG: DUF721 domain-containing protein [Thermodesulfovibrionales bacterium]|nr:DUF721 domain-containing protein [Thermodesulfovibrionales bacterium]
MEKIQSILNPLYDEIGLTKFLLLEEVKAKWDFLVGSPLNMHTYPFELRDSELIINVDSAIWLQQLKFMQSMILSKLGDYPIKSIRLRIGKIKKRRKGNGHSQTPIKQHSKDFFKDEPEWLKIAISFVRDPEIKDQIRRAVITSQCK